MHVDFDAFLDGAINIWKEKDHKKLGGGGGGKKNKKSNICQTKEVWNITQKNPPKLHNPKH